MHDTNTDAINRIEDTEILMELLGYDEEDLMNAYCLEDSLDILLDAF